ncbi:hypothetical protein VTI28DRAFT_8736 [Corynascus sepedonium]
MKRPEPLASLGHLRSTTANKLDGNSHPVAFLPYAQQPPSSHSPTCRCVDRYRRRLRAHWFREQTARQLMAKILRCLLLSQALQPKTPQKFALGQWAWTLASAIGAGYAPAETMV